MLKSILVLLIGVILNCNIVNANSTVVVLNFADYSAYKELHTNEIMEQVIIDKLLELDEISIYERKITNDSLEIEQELTGDKNLISNAITKNDFNSIFNVAQNDISTKKTGDYLPVRKTRLLGQKYSAKYIIHGSIDFIGGNERNNNIVWDSINLKHISNSITIFSSLRVIETQTGRIVWHQREKGKVKDRFDSLNNFSYGTKEFSNQLFYEALDEVSTRIIDALRKNLRNKKLIL